MLYLMEVSYTDKESQSIYSNYTDEVSLLSASETKLGQAMLAEETRAELIIGFDETGRIITNAFYKKEDEVTLSPRLVWVVVNNEGTTPNMQKYTTLIEAKANYHKKRGSAMGNKDTKAIFAMVLDGANIALMENWVRPIEPFIETEPQPEPEVEPVEPTEPEEPTEE